MPRERPACCWLVSWMKNGFQVELWLLMTYWSLLKRNSHEYLFIAADSLSDTLQIYYSWNWIGCNHWLWKHWATSRRAGRKPLSSYSALNPAVCLGPWFDLFIVLSRLKNGEIPIAVQTVETRVSVRFQTHRLSTKVLAIISSNFLGWEGKGLLWHFLPCLGQGCGFGGCWETMVSFIVLVSKNISSCCHHLGTRWQPPRVAWGSGWEACPCSQKPEALPDSACAVSGYSQARVSFS